MTTRSEPPVSEPPIARRTGDHRELSELIADHAREVSSLIVRGEVVTAARATAARAADVTGAGSSAFFIRDGEVDQRPRFVLAAGHELASGERPMLEAAVDGAAPLGRWLSAEAPRPTVLYSRRAKWVCVPVLDATSPEAALVGALAAALPDSAPTHVPAERLAALAAAIGAPYRRRIEAVRLASTSVPLAAAWTEPPPAQ